MLITQHLCGGLILLDMLLSVEKNVSSVALNYKFK